MNEASAVHVSTKVEANSKSETEDTLALAQKHFYEPQVCSPDVLSRLVVIEPLRFLVT